jgi:signal transduction histidine kinase
MAQRVAHRLKNSLSHMLLTIQRLQAEYHDRAPAISNRLDVYSERIQDGIGQLRRETSNLLKLVDVDEPDLAPTDLNLLVSELALRVRKRIPPDVRLVTDLAPTLPHVVVDREQVEEALENLIANAVNATQVGGTVTVTTADGTNLPLAGDGAANDFVWVEVLDTGDGVRSEVEERLFDPGVSSHKDGTGLGLSIVRKIARDHGGEVVFHSEAGVGSVFTLRLPRNGPSSTPDPAHAGAPR